MTITTSRLLEIHVGGGKFQELQFNYYNVSENFEFFYIRMMSASTNNSAQLWLRYASLAMAQFSLRHTFNDIYRLLVKPPDIFSFADSTAVIGFEAKDGQTILAVLAKWLAPKADLPNNEDGMVVVMRNGIAGGLSAAECSAVLRLVGVKQGMMARGFLMF